MSDVTREEIGGGSSVNVGYGRFVEEAAASMAESSAATAERQAQAAIFQESRMPPPPGVLAGSERL